MVRCMGGGCAALEGHTQSLLLGPVLRFPWTFRRPYHTWGTCKNTTRLTVFYSSRVHWRLFSFNIGYHPIPCPYNGWRNMLSAARVGTKDGYRNFDPRVRGCRLPYILHTKGALQGEKFAPLYCLILDYLYSKVRCRLRTHF